MSKSVLNSGKGYIISPQDGTKTKESVSEAFKQSKADGKYSPLVGGGEKVTGSVQIHDNKPNSWVSGKPSKSPTSPEGRKNHTYGS